MSDNKFHANLVVAHFGARMIKNCFGQNFAFVFIASATMVPYVAGVAKGVAHYNLTEVENFGGSVVVEGLNNEGQVIGAASLSNGNYHAFVWSQSTGMVDLGTLSGDPDSQASAINDAGEITGTSTDGGSGLLPFVWQAGSGMVNIGASAGVFAQPTGINASGQVVQGNRICHKFTLRGLLANTDYPIRRYFV